MKFPFFLLVSCLVHVVCSQNSEKLDRYFSKQMRKANIAGMQVAYLSNGTLGWSGSYGTMNAKTGDPVKDNTLFMIASCSKPMTALGIMKLYDQGKLDLDADINTYLPFSVRNPDFPDEKITLRMLLTHTSSLIDDGELLFSQYTLETGGDSPLQLSDFIENYYLKGGEYYSDKNFASYKPASKLSYSNAGYALVGYILQQVSGMTFSEFMQQEIFRPLQMADSYWFLNEIPHENISRPHEYDAENDSYEVLKHFGYPTFPDGQLRTNVQDYSKFLELFLNSGKSGGKSFLKPETVQEFLSIQFPDAAEYQAIAWNYNEFDHWLYYLLMPRLPSHTGADPGVGTVVSFDPRNGTAGIIFTNTPTQNFKSHKIFYQEMMKKLLKEGRRNSSN